MNGEQAQLFQQLLEEACDHFIDGGGEIITKNFTRGDGTACPLTCLLGWRDISSMVKELSEMLDATIVEEELWTFIYTFDGVEVPDYYRKYVSMLLVAKELREKYVRVPA